jgi:hypothetical protein
MTPPILGIWASQISGHLWAPAGAYDALATVTVPSGGAANITFVGIPQGYKHLQLRGIARCASSTDRNLRLYINGDTTNGNYKQHWLYGNGSTANSENNTISPQIGYLPMSSDTASIFGASVTDILDYTSTTKTKTVRSLFGWDGNGSTSGLVSLGSGFQTTSLSAVTSLTIQMSNGSSLAEYTQFALYGVK